MYASAVVNVAMPVPQAARLILRFVFASRKGRKGAKITRAVDNCRYNGAKLRWSLKDAKAGAISLRYLSPAALAWRCCAIRLPCVLGDNMRASRLCALSERFISVVAIA